MKEGKQRDKAELIEGKLCVCVCARERQRSRERETMSERKFKLKTAQIVHKSYDGN